MHALLGLRPAGALVAGDCRMHNLILGPLTPPASWIAPAPPHRAASPRRAAPSRAEPRRAAPSRAEPRRAAP
ncbi:hypothetical protein, partial [Actinoplanes palleronii]|uniref:hypothetical protein n=1 Tax=Actinoplanes palleronii TaxID=113570 RepID=UPI001940A566